jgi:tRNA threonylcarbamoyl adenosine modification protein YjeE
VAVSDRDGRARWEIATASEDDTRRVAAALSAALVGGDVVALEGTLGAGKTVFVRAVAEALGVPRSAGVSSPSYTLVNLYDGGRLPLAHLDLYRLGDDDELEAIGFRDLLDGHRALLVEWPERSREVAEVASIWVRLDDLGPSRRMLVITALDPAAEPALREALAPWPPARRASAG